MVLRKMPALVAANDDCEPSFVCRDGSRIYRIRAGERVNIVGRDKLLVAHPDRPPRVYCAHTGAFLGTVKS